MSGHYQPRLAWEPAFLEAFARLKIFTRAAQEAGVTTGAVYGLRERNEKFERECRRILRETGTSKRAPAPSQWKRVFLEALAETSNVSASAEQANISPGQVYQTRRADTDFAAKWQAALCEGYANLEMEVLGYLRDPKPGRKMDVANALRLLTAHRESFAKEQAVRRNVSAAEVRASIERKVQALREQVAAERARDAR